MLSATSLKEVIEVIEKAVSKPVVEAFRHATRTTHTKGIPLTYATTFRRPEFQWLDRLNVDMHDLLHTEQEYTYLKPLQEGNVPSIRTRISDFRERRSKTGTLTIVVLESEVFCNDERCLTATTTFVLRKSAEEK